MDSKLVSKDYKKPKKFAQTTFKHHKFNPKLLRLKEMNRTFYRKPSETIKCILEKDLNLECIEMEPYTKEVMLELYNGRDNCIEDQKKKKGVKIGPISEIFTTQNI